MTYTFYGVYSHLRRKLAFSKKIVTATRCDKSNVQNEAIENEEEFDLDACHLEGEPNK